MGSGILMLEHVQVVYRWIVLTLSLREQKSAAILLILYKDIFASQEYDLGHLDLLQHEIHLHDEKPFKEQMRRTPLSFQQETAETLSHMLKAGVVQPSTSEWASAPVLVRRKDVTLHYCADYRQLDKCMVKDCFPLALTERCIDISRGFVFFSSVDMASGHLQISIKPEDL